MLVVEDDVATATALRHVLERHGHQVTVAHTGSAALSAAGNEPPDLVLLDLGLPDLDGIEVCRRLRSTLPDVVIVMLSGRAGEMDVVVGLEVGADDYLAKPVGADELLARLHAHLRRAEPRTIPGTTLSVGSLTLDTDARQACVAGRPMPLRRKEFDLLARLAAEPGVAVARATLMAEVWDEHWFGPTKTLDVHVASLRRKLAASGADTPRIVTLRRHGYRLDADPSDLGNREGNRTCR
jgi:DNA-binding response OmpR family regulator